jgi:hypothetical protein
MLSARFRMLRRPLNFSCFTKTEVVNRPGIVGDSKL